MQFEIKLSAQDQTLTTIRMIARFAKMNFYTSIKCFNTKVEQTKLDLQATAVSMRLTKFIRHRVSQYGNNPEGRAFCDCSEEQKRQADNLQHIFGPHYTARGLARVVVMNESAIRNILPCTSSKFYFTSVEDINAIITWAHENN